MLEGDSRQDSVHDERADGLPFPHQAPQDVPVAVAWLEYPREGLGQQGCHGRVRLLYRERALKDTWIR